MNNQRACLHDSVVGETCTEEPRQHAVDASRDLFLSTRQAAALIAVTPHHLAALRMAGRGPNYYRTPTGAAIYYRSDLLTWYVTARSAIAPRIRPIPMYGDGVQTFGVCGSHE